MSIGWFCPSCQKHHGPHIDTCPGFGFDGFPPQTPFHPKPADDFASVKPACKVCGIIFDGPMGYVCPNMRCPSGFATMAMMTTAGAAQ